MDLFEFLKAALRERGWSLTDLARRAGVSKQSVSQWLSEDDFVRQVPGTASCRKIADALGVDRDYVLALAGHRDEPDREPESELDAAMASSKGELESALSGIPRVFWGTILRKTFSRAAGEIRDLGAVLAEHSGTLPSPSLEREVKPVPSSRIKPRTRPFPDDGSGADGSLTVPYPRESVAA